MRKPVGQKVFKSFPANGGVAQMVRARIHNPWVRGSIPRAATNQINNLKKFTAAVVCAFTTTLLSQRSCAGAPPLNEVRPWHVLSLLWEPNCNDLRRYAFTTTLLSRANRKPPFDECRRWHRVVIDQFQEILFATSCRAEARRSNLIPRESLQ